jgi:small subunit ribosomal protein S17e
LFVVNGLGKVRIGKVKGVSKELVSKYGNVFTTDFEVNKKLVYQYSDITSKHLNNRVAGYITRLKVNQKKRDEAEAAEAAEVEEAEAVEVVEEAPAAAAEEAAAEPAAEAPAPAKETTKEAAPAAADATPAEAPKPEATEKTDSPAEEKKEQ